MVDTEQAEQYVDTVHQISAEAKALLKMHVLADMDSLTVTLERSLKSRRSVTLTQTCQTNILSTEDISKRVGDKR